MQTVLIASEMNCIILKKQYVKNSSIAIMILGIQFSTLPMVMKIAMPKLYYIIIWENTKISRIGHV